jgi:Skp family chaperone for outer membrane proteins
MRQRTFLSLLAACAVAGAALAAGTAVAQEAPAKPRPTRKPLKVGVVDIGVLFKSYKRKDSLEEGINGRREEMKGEIEKEQKRIVDLRERLDKSQVRKGSPPWDKAVMDIKMAQYQLELRKEQMQETLKKEVEANTLQILTELEKTIGKYGRKYGYDLILKIDRAEKAADGKQSDLVAHFQERIFRAQISDVLYFGERLDITSNVEKLLNSSGNMKEMERLAAEKGKPK